MHPKRMANHVAWHTVEAMFGTILITQFFWEWTIPSNLQWGGSKCPRDLLIDLLCKLLWQSVMQMEMIFGNHNRKVTFFTYTPAAMFINPHNIFFFLIFVQVKFYDLNLTGTLFSSLGRYSGPFRGSYLWLQRSSITHAIATLLWTRKKIGKINEYW